MANVRVWDAILKYYTAARGHRGGLAVHPMTALPRLSVAPTISGTETPIITIDGSQSAGSKHIEDSTPTEAEAVAEQIKWQFTAGDSVVAVMIAVTVPNFLAYDIGATTAQKYAAHELAALKFIINAASDAVAATALLNGYDDVNFLPVAAVAGFYTAPEGTVITAVNALGALTPLANSGDFDVIIQGGAQAICMGYQDV